MRQLEILSRVGSQTWAACLNPVPQLFARRCSGLGVRCESDLDVGLASIQPQRPDGAHSCDPQSVSNQRSLA